MKRVSGLILTATCLVASACGGPPTASLVDDVLHDVYLRGAPGSGRVAITVDGPDRCTPAVLEAAAKHELTLTLVVSAPRLRAMADALRGPTLARLKADGHGTLPGIETVRWAPEPAAARTALGARIAEIDDLLAVASIEPDSAGAWRPPSADARTLRAAAAARRPVILWSLRAPGGDAFATALPSLLERVTDGDIIALPGADPQPESDTCPVADAVPALAAALSAAELKSVTVRTLLDPRMTRFAPPRVVRYRGPPPAAGCAASAPEGDAPRWGLVHRATDDAFLVQPLAVDASATAALLGATAALRRTWADRDTWTARPGCLHTVPARRLESPITAAGTRWWVVDEGRVQARDARAIGRPGQPVLLPDRADLARFESQQDVPWPVRGVVAGALADLGLDVPLLTESRSTVAIVIGAALEPGSAADDAALRRAVAAYVPVSELSMGEYLFLADGLPKASGALQRTARAADGFLRPGPVMVLAEPGAGPDPGRLAIEGRTPLARPPIALLRAVLAAGHPLRPGDVVAAAAPPPRGAPVVFPGGEAESVAAALRGALGQSLLVAMMLPVYLRPGATRTNDAGLLGPIALRVAVPAGVAAPSPRARPLVDAQPLDPPADAASTSEEAAP